MIFTPIELGGAFIITLDKIADDRGFFARAWCRNEFADHALATEFVQANVAFSKHKGTLRGMHYQIQPYAEAKLVRCIHGVIYDVMIDLRENSPTFKQWFGISLNATSYQMLYVPEGFAHGYLTLSDNTEVFYQVSQFYSPKHERGVLWNDPAFSIEWPKLDHFIISDKDKNWKAFPKHN